MDRLQKSGSFLHPGNISQFSPLLPLLLLLILPFSLESRQVDLRFHTFGINEGLSNENVNCVFMDRHGFLWVGTLDGLNRFDGYSFSQYRHRPGSPNSLNDNYIFLMHDDQLGRMWLRTRMGLEILDPLSGKVTHLGKPEVQGCSLEEIGNGQMWYGTATGKILIFDSKSGRMLPPPTWFHHDLLQRKDGGILNPIHILEDNRGNIWIGCWDRLLRHTPNSDRLSPFGLPNSDIPYLDDHNMYWIPRVSGLSCYDPSRETFRHFPWPKWLGGDISTLDYLDFTSDPSGLIWIGTNLGLAIFNEKNEEYIDPIRYQGEPGSVVPKDIRRFCKDPAGNIWMGFWGGLCRFSPRANRVQLINAPADPQPGFFTNPNCLLEDRTGTIWIGTLDAGLITYNPASNMFRQFKDPLTIQQSSSLYARYVSSLYEDSSGSLWVGTANGLFRYERQSGRFLRFDLPLPSNMSTVNAGTMRLIISIQEERPDTLWISCRDEGIIRINKKLHTSTLFKTDTIIPPGLYPRRLNQLYLDHSHSLWICSGNGIHRLDRVSGRFSHFLPGVFTFSALEDRNGNFWVSSNQGLNLIDRQHGTFKAFSAKQGLDGDTLYHMVEDDDGGIWAGTNRGLTRFDPHSETFQNFGPSDGVDQTRLIYRKHDGQMLAGSPKQKGLIVFDPREVTRLNTYVPPIVITAMGVDNSDVPLHGVFSQQDQSKETGKVKLRPGDRMLSVEFSVLDFTAPEKNRYAFRMEEQGEAWNDLGTRHQLTFSNLVIGTHILRIKGSNSDGVWNETGVALQIEVLPFFWQTWWFKVLALLLLVGIALAIYAVCRTIASLKKIAAPPNLDEVFNKHKISHREQEILRLVIQGKSNHEMEQMLFISLPTVKRHLANIYEKIGVSSRLQLINFLQGRKPRY